MSDARCPYCNGTGTLPAESVARFERMRDEYAIRLHTIGRMRHALYDLWSAANPHTKKGQAALSLEGLRAEIDRINDRFKELPIDYYVGSEDHA